MLKEVDQRQHPGTTEAPISRRAKGLARVVGWIALISVALLAAFGIWGQMKQSQTARETLEQAATEVPTVRTSLVETVTEPRRLDLPGTASPFDSATIYARATGYIAKRNVDIGSRVKKGDVLVIIAAPDLDQQLAQARAQVSQLQASIEQAHANAELAKVTNQRTSQLVQQGWNTQQQGDVTRLTQNAQEVPKCCAGKSEGTEDGGRPSCGADELRTRGGSLRRSHHRAEYRRRRSRDRG